MSSVQSRPAPDVHPITEAVLSFDGTRIEFDLYDCGSSQTAVVVPGFWRDKSYPTMIALAAELNRIGYNAAIVDLRGHGKSEGTYGFNLHEHHDVHAVITWLLEQGSSESIQLVGFSTGGAIAVSTAARHDFPCSGLLLISSVAEFRMISPRINPFTIHRHIAFSQAMRRPRFDWKFRTSRKLSALEDVERVKSPICFIHVKNDWLINHRHSLALYERANEPKQLHVIDAEGNFHADRIFTQLPEHIDPLVQRFLGSCKTKTPRGRAAFTESQMERPEEVEGLSVSESQ